MGHYAEKNHGVCLILDKRKVIRNAKKLNCFCEDVEYTNDASRWGVTNVQNVEDIDSEICKNKHEIFFQKKTNWSYEHEYRILSQPTNRYLPIRTALMGVILHTDALSADEKEVKISILKTLKMNVFEYCDKLFDSDTCLMFNQEEVIFN